VHITAITATTDADDIPAEPLGGVAGSVVVFGDIACPWTTVVVLRLRAAREALGADVPIIHLAHSLELWFERPIARRIVDAEVPLCAAATPEFGWSTWQGRLDEWPLSSLLALEAVQVARRQSETAAEELDLALRRALFVDSRPITLRHEVLRAARECTALDVDRLALDLDAGRGRAPVVRQSAAARAGAADCSGHVVLPDGSGTCAPGIRTDWIGPAMPRGAPRVLADDPQAAAEIIRTAARSRPAGR